MCMHLYTQFEESNKHMNRGTLPYGNTLLVFLMDGSVAWEYKSYCDILVGKRLNCEGTNMIYRELFSLLPHYLVFLCYVHSSSYL